MPHYWSDNILAALLLSVFVINMAPECLLVHQGHIAALISHSATFSDL